MTAMITETRYVTIKGTLIEGATIAIWLAENCPKAASKLNPHDGGAYQIMQVPFDDEAEYAKFKLFHSDEFNEPARRQRDHEANHLGARWGVSVHAGRIAGITTLNTGLSLASPASHDEEEDDD
nr:hypothetical protein [Brevundimonas vesicularis]